MQTFLPEPDFKNSLAILDYRRLGKQRVETKQILQALRGETSGWVNHPAVRMWRGHEGALAQYGYMACYNWRQRGFDDILMPYFLDMIVDYDDPARHAMPLWFGDPVVHLSHQSNLVRKDPQHYRRFYPDVRDDIPYFWPV